MTVRDSPASARTTARARLAAGIVASLTLLAVGWAGLLIPSLLRSIKKTFDQTDAGIGLVYLVYAVAYALGSFAGGPLTERAGRRLTLGAAVLTTAAGVAGMGLAPSWIAFIVATVAIARWEGSRRAQVRQRQHRGDAVGRGRRRRQAAHPSNASIADAERLAFWMNPFAPERATRSP